MTPPTLPSQIVAAPTPMPAKSPWLLIPGIFRCEVGANGTTVHLRPLDGGPVVVFTCTNCHCDKGEK